MFEKLDMWLGKNILVPVIIRVCQTCNITNHYFANVASFLGALCMFYGSWKLFTQPGTSWFWLIMCVLLGLASVWELVIAGLVPNLPLPPAPQWWRSVASDAGAG